MKPGRLVGGGLRRVAPRSCARLSAYLRRRRDLAALVAAADGSRGSHAHLAAAHADLVAEVRALRAAVDELSERAVQAHDSLARVTAASGVHEGRMADFGAALAEQRGLSLRVGQLTDLVFTELSALGPRGTGSVEAE